MTLPPTCTGMQLHCSCMRMLKQQSVLRLCVCLMQWWLDVLGLQVRLTFKPESQQLWIASATNTQRIPYVSISKIESWLIQGHEGYSILALHLGSGGSSKYWLYFFPSQYVSGIKIRLIGLHALL
eukprot:GHRR01033317.1.p1 GENE.GHRR01033317.1~~GHRR01033317.1.p1  ORF type:complete len:125 (+),score=18.36 GHRR01033317.1:808-1182(+)